MANDNGILDGIGGVFLSSNDAPRLIQWYEKHFGLKFTHNFMEFVLVDSPVDADRKTIIFAINAADAKLPPDRNTHTINFRVKNLAAAIAHLRSTGLEVDKTENSDYGNFAWLKDLEGNKIELWEPK